MCQIACKKTGKELIVPHLLTLNKNTNCCILSTRPGKEKMYLTRVDGKNTITHVDNRLSLWCVPQPFIGWNVIHNFTTCVQRLLYKNWSQPPSQQLNYTKKPLPPQSKRILPKKAFTCRNSSLAVIKCEPQPECTNAISHFSTPIVYIELVFLAICPCSARKYPTLDLKPPETKTTSKVKKHFLGIPIKGCVCCWSSPNCLLTYLPNGMLTPG